MGPQGSNLQIIKLDHNPLGDEGANILAQNLGSNSQIQVLSLTYCQIRVAGAQGLFEIIIYQNSKVLELGLTGNPLMQEGAVKIFQALSCAKSLQTIYISDCQWELNDDIFPVIENCMKTNETLTKYDIKHNEINDEGIVKLTEVLREARHVQMIMLSEWIMSEAMNEFNEAMVANKPAKGKKGKKK